MASVASLGTSLGGDLLREGKTSVRKPMLAERDGGGGRKCCGWDSNYMCCRVCHKRTLPLPVERLGDTTNGSPREKCGNWRKKSTLKYPNQGEVTCFGLREKTQPVLRRVFDQDLTGLSSGRHFASTSGRGQFFSLSTSLDRVQFPCISTEGVVRVIRVSFRVRRERGDKVGEVRCSGRGR